MSRNSGNDLAVGDNLIENNNSIDGGLINENDGLDFDLVVIDEISKSSKDANKISKKKF